MNTRLIGSAVAVAVTGAVLMTRPLAPGLAAQAAPGQAYVPPRTASGPTDEPDPQRHDHPQRRRAVKPVSVAS